VYVFVHPSCMKRKAAAMSENNDIEFLYMDEILSLTVQRLSTNSNVVVLTAKSIDGVGATIYLSKEQIDGLVNYVKRRLR